MIKERYEMKLNSMNKLRLKLTKLKKNETQPRQL